MREMKDSKIGWIGDIPVTWNIIRAKNIFKNHKDIVGSKEEEYERLALTLNGVLKRAKDDSKGLQSESLSTYQILNKNELVFKMIDLANVNTSRVGYSPFTGIVSPVYIIFNNEKYAKFGYYFFYSMWQREIFNKLGNDGVRSALNASDMLNLPFPDISEKEAKKISDFLDEKVLEIDYIIEKTKETIEDYKKYKQAKITEIVTKGIEPNEDLQESGINWIGKYPKNWGLKKLKYSTLIRNEKYNEKYGDIQYFALENIESQSGKFLETESVYDLENSLICKNNDIVFGKLRPYLAKVYKVEKESCCSSEFAVFYNFEGEQEYLQYLMLSYGFIKIVDASTYGTKMPRANIEFIKNMIIPIPGLEEQKSILKYLKNICNEIDNLIQSKEKIIEELEQYKKSLIYEYVTGKKEVI